MVFDVARYLGAVVREVKDLEYEGRPARAVVLSRSYDTTLDDLWNALTDPERIPRWFLPVSGDLRLGGRYQFQGNAGGEIRRCEPPRSLAVTWEYRGGMSWVEVELSDDLAGGARLTLEHIAPREGVDPFWDQFGPGAVGLGWDLALMGFGRYIENDSPIDPATGPTWASSEEGKPFTRGASEAWRKASVAYGTDPEAAAGAAARTAAAYLGEA